MPNEKSRRVPTYRLHKNSNRALTTIAGHVTGRRSAHGGAIVTWTLTPSDSAGHPGRTAVFVPLAGAHGSAYFFQRAAED